MPEGFQTLDGRGKAVITDRGSRFVGYAAPAETVEAAEAVVEAVRSDHPDATHVVPAYRIRAAPLRERCDDDGEPGGSAGQPILSVLRGQSVENVVVAVARYFGGTELGIGGLSRAYGRTAGAALEDAGVVERVPRERFTVVVDYDDSGTVRGVLESAGVKFEATYAERVSVEVCVPIDEASTLRDRLYSATSGRAEID